MEYVNKNDEAFDTFCKHEIHWIHVVQQQTFADPITYSAELIPGKFKLNESYVC